MEKANVIPAHRKGDKQMSRTNGPVSLLPKCGKIFERLLYNNMFEFFIKDSLISANQSAFKQGDSCYISFYVLHMKFINHLKTF